MQTETKIRTVIQQELCKKYNTAQTREWVPVERWYFVVENEKTKEREMYVDLELLY